MKISCVIATIASLGATLASAQDIHQQQVGAPITTATDTDTATAIGTKSMLRQSSGMINKNSITNDNNVMITRSNILLSQNDAVVFPSSKKAALMSKRVEALVMSSQAKDMDTGILSKNILTVVSKPDSDAVLMNKASAVAALAKQQQKPQQGKIDQTLLRDRIADFVQAVLQQQEVEKEQAIQSELPRDVLVLVGAKDILRQPTAVVNKNAVMSDNQMTISNSAIEPRQNDQINMADGAKVATVVGSGSNIQVSDKDIDALFRVGFLFKRLSGQEVDQQEEQFLYGPFGFGWSYPLNYWNLYGRAFYPGTCGLGLASGSFFYC
jgi:hypothetical protein